MAFAAEYDLGALKLITSEAMPGCGSLLRINGGFRRKDHGSVAGKARPPAAAFRVQTRENRLWRNVRSGENSPAV